LDCRRAKLAIQHALAAGIIQSEALLLLPVNAASGCPEMLVEEIAAAAFELGLPADRLVIEISADERGSLAPAVNLADACAKSGLSIAVSDFASGPVGLNLLAKLGPR